MNHGSAERREYLRELKALTPSQREAILERDNYTCQIPDCGSHVSLEVHHIDGSCLECTREAYTDPLNCITTCHHCHSGVSALERNYDAIYINLVRPYLKKRAAANSAMKKPRSP
jgi:5-methylcytosine-specific restriction endonuclease McrA